MDCSLDSSFAGIIVLCNHSDSKTGVSWIPLSNHQVCCDLGEVAKITELRASLVESRSSIAALAVGHNWHSLVALFLNSSRKTMLKPAVQFSLALLALLVRMNTSTVSDTCGLRKSGSTKMQNRQTPSDAGEV